jgi:hypothetical protein
MVAVLVPGNNGWTLHMVFTRSRSFGHQAGLAESQIGALVVDMKILHVVFLSSVVGKR